MIIYSYILYNFQLLKNWLYEITIKKIELRSFTLQPIDKITKEDCKFGICLCNLPEDERKEILLKRTIYNLRTGGW